MRPAVLAVIWLVAILASITAFAEESGSTNPGGELEEKDVDEAVKRFTERFGEFQVDLGGMVENKFKQKEEDVERKYEERLAELNEKDKEIILEAIARLENFIGLYPDVSRYTPDAMFRLAELHYQKSKNEFDEIREALLNEYEKQLVMFDEGLLDKEPAPPHPSFDRPVELYETIGEKFPDYRYIDAVYYLLAYAYQEEARFPLVRRSLENLITLRPDSKYIAEAYLRIGDAYFNEMKYEQALPILLKAAKFEDSPFYDQIIYKLASVYFILFDYPNSVDTFAKVADYSEKMEEEIGRPSYFRDEAVKYIAFCYAQASDETGWVSAGEKNAEIYFDNLGGRPWEADCFRDLAKYFHKTTKWDEAIAAYKRVMAKDPWNPTNPELQNEIIKIYMFEVKDEVQQNVERERLVKDYGKDSEWAMHNADNPEALKVANDLALDSLKFWAIYQHTIAQRRKQEGNPEEAKVYYKRAAKAYREFITSFPHDKQAYQLNFQLADALFYSGDFPGAVVEYLNVRDDTQHKKSFDTAAYMVVLCYDNMANIKSGGKLTQTEEEAEAQQRERLKGKVEKKEIPELKRKYIEAGDFYVANTKKPLDQSSIAFNSAWIFLEHNHLDEARDRSVDFVNRFPKDKLAPRAARVIIDTYTLVQDWVKVAEWSEKLASLELGDEEARREMRAKFKVIQGNAIAKYARELDERKEYDKAADQYMKAFNQDPANEQAPAMLFNAAAAYGRASRPTKAMKLYQRLVDEYPKHEFASDALYYVADSAFLAYNLDHASRSFERLYTQYKDIPPKRKCEAIYNHAFLKECNHEYREAARIYEKYVRQCEGIEENAPLILFAVGGIYEKIDDFKNMKRIYEDFMKRYGGEKKYGGFVIKAYYKIGEIYAKRNKTRDAFKYYNKAIDFFDSHPSIQTDFTARNMAGKAKFTIVDVEFRRYERIKIAGRNQKKMIEAFEKKEKQMAEVIILMTTVKDYKSPEYFLAADYRSAYAVELFADAWFDAPVPSELKKAGEEYVLEYQQQLTEKARPYFEQAAQLYVKAREGGIETKLFSSPWFKKIIQALNRPNIQNVVGEESKLRKPEKPRFRERAKLPLKLDNGQPHVRVKAEVKEPSPEEQEKEPKTAPEEPAAPESAPAVTG